jgi:hypothetical protein
MFVAGCWSAEHDVDVETAVVESEVNDIVFYGGQVARRTRGLSDVAALQCRLGACDIELSAVHCERASPSEWKCAAVVVNALPNYSHCMANTDVE